MGAAGRRRSHGYPVGGMAWWCMVPFPESLKIQRCIADERKLLDTSRAWLEGESRPGGLHASGLLDPLKEFWGALDPKPVTDREVPIFLVGKVLHAFVLGALDGYVDLSSTDSGSRYHERLGFWYSIDWDKGEVAEFKTSRLFKEPRDSRSLDMYIEQTLVYMVAKGVTEAKIWVLFINLRDPVTKRTSPQFRSYKITISEDDLKLLDQQIEKIVQQLKKAIETENPEGLPLCREFKCGRGNCVYWDRCKPAGRYGDPAWEGTLDERVEGEVLERKAPKVSRSKKAKNEVRRVSGDVYTSEEYGIEGNEDSSAG